MCIALRDVVRTLCILFSSFLILAPCISVLWPIYYIHCTLFSYMMMMYVFLHLTLHVLFLFYLYTCFFMYTILISISHMMHWWILFKCFRKTSCESLSCHELFSCKVFQEFEIEIDLLCNTTSGYEFSDLWLLSWLFVLLWFCHGLPKEEIVRDEFYVIS